MGVMLLKMFVLVYKTFHKYYVFGKILYPSTGNEAK